MSSWKFDNETITYITIADNIWYQDSIGITQLTGTRSLQTDLKDTLYTIPLGYRFIDMRRKWVYEYRTLSDTAQVVQKYGNADSVQLTGGWNFFRKATIKFDSLRIIGDTTIESITYQKRRYVQDFQGTKIQGEALFRCDRKGTLFLLDTGLSDAVGCPQVKATSLSKDNGAPISSVEIEFISNKFPDSVKRVFKAWRHNVELYPVQ